MDLTYHLCIAYIDYGTNIDGEKLTVLRLAYVVALTTNSVEDLEIQLNILNHEGKIGLKIHRGKNKF